MNNLGPWSTEDFEQLSWHDVHVHGIKLEEFWPDNGSADLLLDIDYILRSGSNLELPLCSPSLRHFCGFIRCLAFGSRLTTRLQQPA